MKTKSNPIKTLMVLVVALLIVFLIFKRQWILLLAVGLGITGILSDYVAEKIEYWWLKFAELLARVFPNILLSAVFYLILFPLAILSRLFGKSDPLLLKNSKESTFADARHKTSQATLERPW